MEVSRTRSDSVVNAKQIEMVNALAQERIAIEVKRGRTISKAIWGLAIHNLVMMQLDEERQYEGKIATQEIIDALDEISDRYNRRVEKIRRKIADIADEEEVTP